MTLPNKVDTSLNVQNLLSVIGLAIIFIGWAIRIESRVSVVEANQKTQEAYTASYLIRLENKTDQLLNMHLKRGGE
jgi:hypothetical protein